MAPSVVGWVGHSDHHSRCGVTTDELSAVDAARQALRERAEADAMRGRAWAIEGRAWGISRHGADGLVATPTMAETLGFAGATQALLNQALNNGDYWTLVLALRGYDFGVGQALNYVSQ